MRFAVLAFLALTSCGPLEPTTDAGTTKDASSSDVATDTSTPCVGDYASCTAASTCCTAGFVCNPSTFVCQAACYPINSLCTGNGDCCSGICNGTCQ